MAKKEKKTSQKIIFAVTKSIITPYEKTFGFIHYTIVGN